MTQYESCEARTIRLAEEHLQAVYAKLYNTIGFFDKSYIAGGAIASLFLDTPVNDYDFWFESKEAWGKAVDLVLGADTPCLPVSNVKVIEVLAFTDHALTFKLASGEVIQMVKSRVGHPEEVTEQFDFRHTQAFFCPREADAGPEIVFVGGNCYEFIQEKILLFDGSLDFPCHTLSRLQKFALRGYTVPDQTLAKLVLEIRNAPADLIQRDIRAVGNKYHTGPGTTLRYTEVSGAGKVAFNALTVDKQAYWDALDEENNGNAECDFGFADNVGLDDFGGSDDGMY